MASVRLFAALREAAGVSTDAIDASSVGELLDRAREKYGDEFSASLAYAQVAVNGVLSSELDGLDTKLLPSDEVALLPPVSGGTDRTSRVVCGWNRGHR